MKTSSSRSPSPQDLISQIRDLSLQTHLAIAGLLQHPLYRHVHDQVTQAEFNEVIFEELRKLQEEFFGVQS